MQIERLEAEIREGSIASVYLVVGSREDLRVERFVRDLLTAALPAEFRDVNQELFLANETGAQVPLDAARTTPFLGGRRVVLVRGIEDWKEGNMEQLVAYLERPVETACLILTVAKADKRRKYYKAADARGRVVEFPPLYDRQLPGAMRAEAARCGLTLSADAVALLVEYAGADLWEVSQVLEKIGLSLGERRRVEAEDVRELVIDAREVTAFQLCDALGMRDLPGALLTIHKLFLRASDAGGSGVAIQLLGALAYHWRRIWRARELLDSGASRKAAAAKLGIRGFFEEGFFKQVEGFSQRELRHIWKRLADADMTMKTSGRLPLKLVLDKLALDICLAPDYMR